MSATTFSDLDATLTFGGQEHEQRSKELDRQYRSILQQQQIGWTSHYRLLKPIGSGGQGTVYLSRRRGADNFTLPIAIKIFSPEKYHDTHSYEDDMARLARVGSRVAQIQEEHLLAVHDFVDRNRIRMMLMEWVDGYDLSRLLINRTLNKVKARVSLKRWDYINSVVVTHGFTQPRLKPGTAVAIVRECLAALAALHRDQIVHGDIKPSNIMIKRTGNTKIVDIGSAFEVDDPPLRRSCTPAYAAPEVLDGAECTPRSDLASLGYVLIEMLSGQHPFPNTNGLDELLAAKRSLPQRLHEILPGEVMCNELLTNFCRGLIAPDPTRRFPSAEDADFRKGGAAAFHRQLIKSDLASEYENDLRIWVEELRELDELEKDGPRCS